MLKKESSPSQVADVRAKCYQIFHVRLERYRLGTLVDGGPTGLVKRVREGVGAVGFCNERKRGVYVNNWSRAERSELTEVAVMLNPWGKISTPGAGERGSVPEDGHDASELKEPARC